MSNNRVVHFEIQADDVERAKNFYEGTFGWKIDKIMTGDKKGSMDYWGITTGEKDTVGINGGMYIRTPERKLNTFDCTITVNNIDEAISLVKKNGGMIRQEKMKIPNVGWFAGIIDTEGNYFNLMEPSDWQPK